MPKNKGKGGKNRRRGKNENEETKRQLEFKEPGQEYSQVVRMLGNGRCECYCFDGVTRLASGLASGRDWELYDSDVRWPPRETKHVEDSLRYLFALKPRLRHRWYQPLEANPGPGYVHRQSSRKAHPVHPHQLSGLCSRYGRQWAARHLDIHS